MFCTNCGKQIPDNIMFCKYCGHKIEIPKSGFNQNQVSNNNTSYPEIKKEIKKTIEESFNSYNVDRKKWIIIATIILVIIGGFYIGGHTYTCDWCDKTFIGTAYYEAGGREDVIMCENCAKKYYQGFDYSRFTVD